MVQEATFKDDCKRYCGTFQKRNFWYSLPFTAGIKTNQQSVEKNNGIQLYKQLEANTSSLIRSFCNIKGFQRIQQLLLCLQQIGNSNQYSIHTHNFSNAEEQINPAIELIFDYSFKNYLRVITLRQIAEVASMSIPTFCRFFKKNVKKTYFDFLQELRIGYACQLLSNSNKPILEICYESGFNSWAHFSKKFKQLKHTTPSCYRTEFTNTD